MELRELLQNITPPDEAATGTRRTAAGRRAQSLWAAWVCWRRRSEDIAALTGDAQAPLCRVRCWCCARTTAWSPRALPRPDSSVTAAVTRNLAAGRTSVCRMAQAAQCAVVPVDMGVRDFAPAARACWPGASATARGICAQEPGHDAGPRRSRPFRRARSLCARRRKRACVCWPRARWASATPPRPALWPACCWAARPWK